VEGKMDFFGEQVGFNMTRMGEGREGHEDLLWYVDGAGLAGKLEETLREQVQWDVRLLKPWELSNAERIIKEEEDGLDFDLEMVKVTEVEAKNLHFASLSDDLPVVLSVTLSFYGLEQVLEVETGLLELATKDLSWLVENKFADRLGKNVFAVPECVSDGDCYNLDWTGLKGDYCRGLCDEGSKEWYGQCPRDYGECFKHDKKCFDCFGKCVLMKCVYE
jgi:hypothetical protein